MALTGSLLAAVERREAGVPEQTPTGLVTSQGRREPLPAPPNGTVHRNTPFD
jgi:hypothetical protein